MYFILLHNAKNIKADKLIKSLSMSLEKHVCFKVKIKKVFLNYYYLENNAILKVEKSCEILKEIDLLKNNNFLFSVSYYDNKIYFNFFHALTDGFGAIQFITTVLKYYNDKQIEEIEKEQLNQHEIENAFAVHSKKAKFLKGQSLNKEIFNFKKTVPFL